MKDVKDYFPTTKWRVNITEGGAFEAKGRENDLSVKIDPSHIMYTVDMEAEDDSSDSTHDTTDKPLDIITDFLGVGIPGGDIFKQKASVSPNIYCEVLRHIAARVEHIKRPARLIRRIAILLNLDLFSTIINRYAANPTDFRMTDRILNNFKEEAKQKGWKFEITDSEPPGLHMNVHGFDVNVGVDSIMYDYMFELEGYPESKEEGQAADPIEEFEKWKKSDKLKDAVEKYNEDIEEEDSIPTRKT